MNFDNITAYPISWPIGWERRQPHQRRNSQFAAHTLASAVAFVLDEIRLLSGRGAIISTNIALRNDGLPRSGQKTPADPGAAVYFTLKGKPKALACDQWTRVEDNLWAIGKHIEALRGQARWGVGNIDQAFMGYAALPAPAYWWEVLGVGKDATMGEIQTAYRALARKHHPDGGGDTEVFLRIQTAYEEARKERG